MVHHTHDHTFTAMNYAEEQAQEIIERFNKAFDKSLQLQAKKDAYKVKDRNYWELMDKLDKAQTRCRYIDTQLKDHLLKIKPNFYEQIRIY